MNKLDGAMELAKSLQRITVVFLALLLGSSGVLYAQGQNRAGTSASPQLQIPLGGQYLSGSGASSDVHGIESVLWNPAGLDREEKGEIQAMFTRRQHIADIGVNFLAAAVTFEDIGTFAAHIRNFNIGEIQETDEFNAGGTGGTFEPTFFTIGVSYGIELSDNIGVGVTSNVTNESFAGMSATGVTFDAGVQYGTFLDIENLDIGVSVRNIGTSMTYGGEGLLQTASSTGANRPSTQFEVVAADAEIPTTVDLSAGYTVWRGLRVQATYSENTFKPSKIHGQLQYNFRDILIVRGSYSQLMEDRGDLEGVYEDRPSFGGTLNLEPALGVDVSFDYAFVSTEFFDNNHIISLRGSF